MRITFEAVNIRDLILQMEHVIASVSPKPEVSAPQAPSFGTVPKAIVREDNVQVAKPPIVDRSVSKPVDKPVEKRARTEKQLANDEKMRVAALARIAAKKAAKVQEHGYATTLRKDLDRDPIEKQVVDAPEAQPFAEPEEVDPAEMVKIRLKTIEELQAAYANGHQKEVFELLSRFGNGAKSFRELPPESFMPIRKAIDLGALE